MNARVGCTAVGILFAMPFWAAAQSQKAPEANSAASSVVSADYPLTAGMLIQSSDWLPLSSELPAKTHMKHALAPTFTYGIAPATAISDYQGLRAAVQVEPGRPVICICHMISLPAPPALVRLHPKKDFRELDGNKIHFGLKMVKADANDLIPIDVSQPENMVWLIRPREPLPAGEYAVMLGIQNLSIFPFSVAGASEAGAAKP